MDGLPGGLTQVVHIRTGGVAELTALKSLDPAIVQYKV
jgi:hypothetical protein